MGSYIELDTLLLMIETGELLTSLTFSSDVREKCKDPEFIRKLIDIYQRHPALWKVKAKCNATRDLRKKGYDELLKHFKTGNATQETVRNKINNLRSAFRKEFKKSKKVPKKTGSSTDDVYVPNLWYYDLLLFTAHQEEPRNTVSSNESDDDENTQSENVSFLSIYLFLCK
ncbi:hypothetical protein NQ314_021409 [Rhamnusium bicolor]|uniref:MADF domain-containing protein n=1 Tax=Rhamnusium bicolor TaxID=1586634 RepID=A0AAV8WHK0_9CUCU|nr:hypothetical protein NQ314_021409 [Rhamnusium bicolor]